LFQQKLLPIPIVKYYIILFQSYNLYTLFYYLFIGALFLNGHLWYFMGNYGTFIESFDSATHNKIGKRLYFLSLLIVVDI